MKPYTEQSMQIERAPWLPEDFVDMDHLFTELTLENIIQAPKGPKGTTVSDYRDLFNEDLPGNKSGNKLKEKGLNPPKKMCIRVSKDPY